MKVKDLMQLTKKELILKIRGSKISISKQVNKAVSKQRQIRNFRMRLKKIRDSMDYLLNYIINVTLVRSTLKLNIATGI